MAAQSTCDTCAIVVDGVHCEEHARPKCSNCKKVNGDLLCEDCAEEEYGDDGSEREPNEDDVIALIEYSVVSDDLGDLAAAIRRGDMQEAEYLLDKVARQVPGWTDCVSLGRYSPAARTGGLKLVA